MTPPNTPTENVGSNRLSDITDKIKGTFEDLMDKIKGLFGMEKEKVEDDTKNALKELEIKCITELTENDLLALKKAIKDETKGGENLKITRNEEKIFKKIIDKNEDIKTYFNRLNTTKGFKGKNNIINREKQKLLLDFHGDSGQITSDELASFIQEEKEAKGKIEANTDLKSIITSIDGKYSIEEIIKAYEEIKEGYNEENEEGNEDKLPTKEEVLVKLG